LVAKILNRTVTVQLLPRIRLPRHVAFRKASRYCRSPNGP
jgi:hypothetical protein